MGPKMWIRVLGLLYIGLFACSSGPVGGGEGGVGEVGEGVEVAEMAQTTAPAPVEAMKVVRRRPVEHGIRWWRVDRGRMMAWAPKGAVSYRDGGLVRRVYWSVEECGVEDWVGKLRITRYCGAPGGEIEIEYADGYVQRVGVETIRCIGEEREGGGGGNG